MKPAYFICREREWNTAAILVTDEDEPTSARISFCFNKNGEEAESLYTYNEASGRRDWQEVPFERALTKLETDVDFNKIIKKVMSLLSPVPPPLKAGDYPITFKPDGIQVGCTFVSNETIKEIATRQKIKLDA